MSDTTPRHRLPLLVPGQAQKEVTLNDALASIDALLLPQLAGTVDAPPADAATGSAWIVGATETGAFAGQTGRLALRHAGGWRFIDVPRGTLLPGTDGVLWRRSASGWERAPLWHAPAPVAGGQAQDDGARAAIVALAQLLEAAGLMRIAE